MPQTLAMHSSFVMRKNGSYHLVSRLRILLYLGGIFTIFLLVFYIFQIQEIIADRYQLRVYNSKFNALSKSVQDLESKINSFSSLDYVSHRLSEEGFVKVNNIVFLPISAGYLASVK